MKFGMVFNGIVVGFKSKPYTTQAGKTGTSYSLCVEIENEADNFPCDEKVYHAFDSGALRKYCPCRFSAEFDSNYKRVKILDVEERKRKERVE